MAEQKVKEVTDHVAGAQARLPGHLRAGANFLKMVELLISPVQDLETDLRALLVDKLLDGTGAQLDQVGEILDVARLSGESDSDYKTRLLGFATQKISSGEMETLIQAMILLLDANKVYTAEHGPATVELTAQLDPGEDDTSTDTDIITSMNKSVAAGVTTILQTVETSEFWFGDQANANASGGVPFDADHGFGDSDDADVNGDITPGAGNGGNWARVLTT